MSDPREANLSYRDDVQATAAAFAQDVKVFQSLINDLEGADRLLLHAIKDSILAQHDDLIASIAALRLSLKAEQQLLSDLNTRAAHQHMQ